MIETDGLGKDQVYLKLRGGVAEPSQDSLNEKKSEKAQLELDELNGGNDIRVE